MASPSFTDSYPADQRLDVLLEAYDVDEAGFAAHYQPLAFAMAELIAGYETAGGKPYGAEQLWPHLQRVSADGARFLATLGYSETACRNFHSAYLFSDLGKVHPDYAELDWMKDDRPTPAEKELRRIHTAKGPALLDQLIADLGIDAQTANHPHFTVMKALMLYHHERLDGKGELGLAADQLGTVAQVAALVDALDGDMIPRAHQPGGRTLEQALERLTGRGGDSKYAGAFAPTLLTDYTAYKRNSN